MALTVGTDSFISIDDAEGYMRGRLHADAWPFEQDENIYDANGAVTGFSQAIMDQNTANDTIKENALRTATMMLCRERFVGCLASSSQSLAWPRRGVVDSEGRCVPSDAIPLDIAHATAELALALIKVDLTDEHQRRLLYRAKSERIGESAATFEPTAEDLPAIVRAILAPYLASRGGSSTRLVP